MGRIRITDRKKIKPVGTIKIDVDRESIKVHDGKIKRQINKKYGEVLKRIELPPANLPRSKRRELFAVKLMEECDKNSIKIDKYSAYLIAARTII